MDAYLPIDLDGCGGGDMSEPLKYDRRKYLLQSWEAQLRSVMAKSNIYPQTCASMTVTTTTDSIRDLMEYAIKGIHHEIEKEFREKAWETGIMANIIKDE